MRHAVNLAVWAACFMLIGSVGHAATDPAARCKDTKARAAGKKAADLMTAFGRNFKLPDPVRLAFGVSKAQSKLTKQFSKADARGGCQTVDDAAPIEAKVDALVIDVVAAFGGTTTTTTTSTTTTTTTTATSMSTTTTTTTTSTTTITTTTTFPPACDCCAMANRLTFTASTPAGNCGVLRNFRCSNNNNRACGVDGDCNEGPCGATVPGFCGDLSPLIACTGDADCLGTCGEVIASGLPFDLECGGLYFGGGGSPEMPVGLSDTMTVVADVIGCSGATGAIALGPTTPAETGSARTCTSTGCLFGAPLPLVFPSGSAPYSQCAVASLTQDASGSGSCNGDMSLDLSVAAELYLTGDLVTNVAGIQPCPLCVRQCSGGMNDRAPCGDDSECVGGGTCGSTTECLGGTTDAQPCTPGTTGLGDAFPVSQDCLPDPSVVIAEVAFDLTLTTTPWTIDAATTGNGEGQQRVLAGFCRDNFGVRSLCFEGDPGDCPSGGASTWVACRSNADCDDGDEYESCAQRADGAFGRGAATRISLAASAPGVCLDDGVPRAATLAAAFGVPPTFEPVLDALHTWPGPGAVTLEGDVRLVP